MYSLDINFLNDRVERPTEVGRVARPSAQDSPRPLYLGLLAGVLLPALVLGAWLYLQYQNSKLVARQQELDSQLATLQAALREVENVNAQVAQISAENQALATVFDQIRPWSAMLQDFSGRVPAGVRIRSAVQTEPPPAAAPAPAPAPADPNQPAAPVAVPEPLPPQIEISGFARNFNEVNDFVLLLKQSPFLDAASVRLESAQTANSPIQVELVNPQQQQQTVQAEFPDVVDFKIVGRMTKLPASELLQDMKEQLSLGLPARIDALRDLGVTP